MRYQHHPKFKKLPACPPLDALISGALPSLTNQLLFATRLHKTHFTYDVANPSLASEIQLNLEETAKTEESS